MKQTAVEWLEKILQCQKDKPFDYDEWCIAIEHAKEMEKEQIIKAASNNSAKEAYRAGQHSMYCGCYEIDGCTNYEEWIYKKQEQINKE
jgi:hypothetical protein